MSDETKGWDNYSRLVLQQLENLSKSIESMREEFHDVKDQIASLKANEDKIMELKEWKSRIDEVVSPSQLKYVLRDIESLKMFKTKAITIFTVVQFGMAFFAWAVKYIDF
tara:strand:+ start:7152 stop:7481 length:330 start_codon:yes stop_codon:yes gene_type:complete